MVLQACLDPVKVSIKVHASLLNHRSSRNRNLTAFLHSKDFNVKASQSLALRSLSLFSRLCRLSNHLMCPSAKVLQDETLEPFNGTIITMIKESCHCANLP